MREKYILIYKRAILILSKWTHHALYIHVYIFMLYLYKQYLIYITDSGLAFIGDTAEPLHQGFSTGYHLMFHGENNRALKSKLSRVYMQYCPPLATGFYINSLPSSSSSSAPFENVYNVLFWVYTHNPIYWYKSSLNQFSPSLSLCMFF